MTRKNSPERRAEDIMRGLGLTRQQLANRLGISLSSVAMYFTGHHRIRRVVALAIQAELGVSADWIMDGRGEKMLRPESVVPAISEDALVLARAHDQLPDEDRTFVRWLVRSLGANRAAESAVKSIRRRRTA